MNFFGVFILYTFLKNVVNYMYFLNILNKVPMLSTNKFLYNIQILVFFIYIIDEKNIFR
jgi:hypothetical protein